MSTPQTVKVLYKYVDGAHFFVSNDKPTLGLCLAHKDLEIAFNAVAPTLTKLFRENHGEEVVFTPTISLSEFRQRLNEVWPDQLQEMPEPSPAGGVSWQQMDQAA